MNIVHALGWGLVGFIGMFLFITALIGITGKKVDSELTKGVLIFSFITGLAVFLLNL